MQDLLFLSQRIPYPPNKGDKIRSYHFLRHLCARYRVHLGFFVDDPADWPHLPLLEGMAASVCALPLDRRLQTVASLRGLFTGQALSQTYFHDRRMAKWVRRIVGEVRPAATFLFSSPMAQYVLPGPRTPRLVMDFVDVDSDKWAQYAAKRSGPVAWLYRREADRLLDFERMVAAGADASIFVTAPERALFCARVPGLGHKVHAIENGIDAEYFSPEHALPSPYPGGFRHLVFTGAMDYWPNIEAVGWFAAEVLPRLTAEMADLRFSIVGSNPVAEVRALAALPGVEVVGRVPDMRPYLAHAAAVVAPLRTARGVQNKVLEGMAMARPVVATEEAHEGVAADPGVQLMVAPAEPEAFARAVLAVLQEPLASRLGQAGRRRVLERYDWSSRFAQLDALLEGRETVAS